MANDAKGIRRNLSTINCRTHTDAIKVIPSFCAQRSEVAESILVGAQWRN